MDDLEVGMFLALDLEKYQERPLIAVVKELREDGITVAWYGGSWTTKWAVAKRKEGRQWVEWVEDVQKEDVVLFDFKLTNKGKLRLPTVRHLREAYGMDSDCE